MLRQAKFDKAVRIAQQAFDCANSIDNRELGDDINIKLELFKRRKPYRESIPDKYRG